MRNRWPVLRKFSMSSVILWGMVVVAGAYFVYLRAPDWLEEEPDPRSQEFLSKIAAEINRSIPVMIDQETELMPAVGAPGMLIYNYRLVNVFSRASGSQQIRGGGERTIKRGRLQPARNSG